MKSARKHIHAFLIGLNILCSPPAMNSAGLLKLNGEQDPDADDRIDNSVGIDPELIG